jgi:hypothetical protein
MPSAVSIVHPGVPVRLARCSWGMSSATDFIETVPGQPGERGVSQAAGVTACLGVVVDSIALPLEVQEAGKPAGPRGNRLPGRASRGGRRGRSTSGPPRGRRALTVFGVERSGLAGEFVRRRRPHADRGP